MDCPIPAVCSPEPVGAQAVIRAYEFPPSAVGGSQTLNMSFSGLQNGGTCIAWWVHGKQDFSELRLTQQQQYDIAASFEREAIDCVIGKARLAIQRSRTASIVCGWWRRRQRNTPQPIAQMADELEIELVIAPKDLCTDNAVMGAIAWEKVARGEFSALDIDIQPGLLRGA